MRELPWKWNQNLQLQLNKETGELYNSSINSYKPNFQGGKFGKSICLVFELHASEIRKTQIQRISLDYGNFVIVEIYMNGWI